MLLVCACCSWKLQVDSVALFACVFWRRTLASVGVLLLPVVFLPLVTFLVR